MSKYNAKAILLGLTGGTVSKEDNDLNITINAEHEGDNDAGEGEAADLGADPAPVETVEETTPVEAVPGEGEVIEEPVVDAAEAVADDTSGTPEAAELDVQEAAEDMDETQEQIENVNEATEGLEALAITLAQISVEGIEVTPLAAQMLNNQYDYAVRKFPALRHQSLRVASCEDFAVSTEDATTVSLEKVMDGIKNGIKAIITFLKELGQKFMAMLGHVISASAIMKRKAQALQGQAKSFKGQPKEVSVAGLLTTPDFSVASIKQLADLLSSIGTKAYEQFLNIDARSSEDDIDNLIKNGPFIEAIKPYLGKSFIGGFKIENSNGGPTLTSVEGKDGVKVKLSGTEAAAFAGAIVNLADAIEAYKRGVNIRKRVLSALTGKAEGIAAVEEERKPRYMQVIRRGMKLVSEQMAFEKRLIAKALAVGNATNNVVAAAIDGKVAEGAKPSNAPQLGAPKK